MKKVLFLVVATFALVACNNDDNYVDEPIAAHISATIGKSAESRASETSWAEGDEIGITMTGNNVSYVNLKYTTGAGDGKFTGTTMYFKNHIDPLTLTAYYPYTGDEGTSPAIMEASTTAERQTSEDQPEFDFLYARLENVTGSTPNVEFTFSHQMSKLTFIFENGNDGTDVSKITSYTIDGLVLDGTFNAETGVCAVTDVAPATLSIIPDKVENNVALPSLIVFPQITAGKNVRLKIHDSEGQDYTCPLSFGDDGIVAGNNYQYTIKVSKTELSVNSSITNWTLVEIKNGHEAKSDDSDELESPENLDD